MAGMALKNTFNSVNGILRPKKVRATLWISLESPEKPPGTRPPCSTKVFMLMARMALPARISKKERISLRSVFFFSIVPPKMALWSISYHFGFGSAIAK